MLAEAADDEIEAGGRLLAGIRHSHGLRFPVLGGGGELADGGNILDIAERRVLYRRRANGLIENDQFRRVFVERGTVLENHGGGNQGGGDLDVVSQDRPGVGARAFFRRVKRGRRFDVATGDGLELGNGGDVPVSGVINITGGGQDAVIAAVGEGGGGGIEVAAEFTGVEQAPENGAVLLGEDGDTVIGDGFLGHQVGNSVQRPRRDLHRHRQRASAQKQNPGPQGRKPLHHFTPEFLFALFVFLVVLFFLAA